jgi:hypothetical protein
VTSFHAFIASAPNQHIWYLAFAINRQPEILMSAIDPGNLFIEVPPIVRTRPAAGEPRSDVGARFLAPSDGHFHN